MIKEISLLLLLDYSGSMEQTFDGKVKIEMMRQNLQGIIETTNPEALVSTVIYGSNPSLQCQDFKETLGTPSETLKTIHITRPGAYGKTPLSDGLRRVAKIAEQKNINQIISLTDGGDSCNQDPCKAMTDVDEQLNKSKRKLSLVLIAFDLKNEKSKLSCIKDLKLKNLQVSVVDANNRSQIYQSLIDAQKNDLGINLMISDEGEHEQSEESLADNKKSASNINNRSEPNNTSGSNGKAKSANGKQEKPTKSRLKIKVDEGVIEITGAPTEAEFEINGGTINRKWHGAFAMTLKAGLYNVRYIDTYGVTLPINLEAGDLKRIPWASLMKNATSKVTLEKPILSLKLTPDENTRKIHGNLSSTFLEGNIDGIKPLYTDLQFGDWKIEVTSPVWLKDAIPVETLAVQRGIPATTNLQDKFQKHLRWIINPYPGQMSVLELTLENKAPENFLIAPGQMNIPIPKNAKARFVTK